MIKVFTFIFLFAFLCSTGHAQNKFTDSLMRKLEIAKEDTSRVLAMAELCYFYRYTNIDSSMLYGQSALTLAQQIKFLRGQADAMNKLGLAQREKGDLPKSLEMEFKALKIAQDNGYETEIAECFRRIGHVYMDLKDYPKAVSYSLRALNIDTLVRNERGRATESMDLGMIYQQMGHPDSALYYAQHAFEKINLIEDLSVEVYRVLGNIQAMKGNKNNALSYYQKGIQVGLKINDFRTISFIYANMAEMFRQMNQPDSSIYYAEKGVEYGEVISYKKGILLSGNLLSQLYDSINPKEALRYYKLAAAAKDSLFGAGNIQTIQTLITEANERQKEVDAAKVAYQNDLKEYGLLTGLGVLLIIALILYSNNAREQKANKVLENTLTNLKSTQSQLIQSEKMASLGELTAGIAHEIQNPLNFVNNFSDVNRELIEELQEERQKAQGTRDGQMQDEILNDIKENEKKINHHGKRADAIVKGMLQHSRSSTGVKEATDINKLADEYLRLASHGSKAKDNSFNVIMKTDFDESIGKINIIPQDIGKVLLNLYNNAFYAVNEKKKASTSSALQPYDPTISVSTKKSGNQVSISVSDNGTGIPEKIVDKIFQPFFTTKPTGQGTGLGLSLSYDIIKAHGGEIKVETKETEGTTFIIQLPAN
jgi:signal transduction histidine kinase